MGATENADDRPPVITAPPDIEPIRDSSLRMVTGDRECVIASNMMPASPWGIALPAGEHAVTIDGQTVTLPLDEGEQISLDDWLTQ